MHQLASKWMVIFRSANPQQMEHCLQEWKEMAVPIANNVSDNIKYLRLSCSLGYVIISIKKEKLLQPVTGEVDRKGVNWCGDNAFACNAYHMGIYNIESNAVMAKRSISVGHITSIRMHQDGDSDISPMKIADKDTVGQASQLPPRCLRLRSQLGS